MHNYRNARAGAKPVWNELRHTVYMYIDAFYIHIMQYVDFIRTPARMQTASRSQKAHTHARARFVLLLRRMIHDAVDDSQRFSEGRTTKTDDDTLLGMLPFANMAHVCVCVATGDVIVPNRKSAAV